MDRFGLTAFALLGTLLFPRGASATKSAELYTSAPYGYGRFEARMRFAAGDGVVSAFFLWKDGSEQPGTFWNELDYEKIGANCELSTNALYGNPSANHTTKPAVSADLCGEFHVYGYEWTADYIAWFLDGAEIRRETGATAAAFAENASAGMQVHFNLWPGDASFGGNFNPSILPVHHYVDWVQYSSYANGTFTLAWREDFSGPTAPSGWVTGDWASPKNLSTHDPRNVNFLSGYAVLSLTADDATGPAGAMSGPDPGTGGAASTGGTSGDAGAAGTVAGASSGGAAGFGGTADPASGGASAVGGTSASGAAGSAGGTTAVGEGASGAGTAGPSGSGGTVEGGSSGSVNSGGTAQGGASSGGGSPMAGNPGIDAAGATTGDATETGDPSGCGCRLPGSTRPPQREPGIAAALLLALAGAFRRRRACRGVL
jgi:MYXO-CTERM domain-containing protein